MRTLIGGLSAALLLLAVTLGPARAGQDGAKPPVAPVSDAPDAFHAGAQHALLQSLAGTWDAVIVAPDGKGGETRTQGTLTTTKHAGFFTIDAFEGEFMGMKLVGHGMNGYCTVRRKFFTYWTDSMTSSPLTAYGDWDAARRELVLRGECHGPSGRLEPIRIVVRLPDGDHRTWTLLGAGPDGGERELLRVEYARRR